MSQSNGHFSDPEKQRAARRRCQQFWSRFFKKYPTPQDAEVALFKRCLKAKPPCCRKRKITVEPGQRSAKCSNCHVETWFTAGTLFEKVENCRAWLAGLMCFEQRIDINPNAFSKKIGCSGSAGWDIFQKLRMVADRQMEHSGARIRSEQFFMAICKRSTETPARQHPLTEIDVMRAKSRHERREQARTQIDVVETALNALPAECRSVYDLLGPDPLHIDVIVQQTGMAVGNLTSVLVQLEIAGLVKCQGNRYSKVAGTSNNTPGASIQQRWQANHAQKEHDGSEQVKPSAASAKLNPAHKNQPCNNPAKPPAASSSAITFKSLAELVDFIRMRFHGLSRKYLQLYIAGISCLVAPEKWPRGSLFEACVNTEPITRDDIRAYVSELHIAVPFLAA